MKYLIPDAGKGILLSCNEQQHISCFSRQYLAYKRLTLVAFLAMMVLSAPCQENGGYMLTVQRGAGGFLYNLGPTGIWASGPNTETQSEGLRGCFIVHRAEVGSPAQGLLFEHDKITGANGKAFPKEEDPRYAMAWAIEDSEASDGRLVLDVTRSGKAIKVTIMLDKLPAYSPTWPFDCERSDAIVQMACEFLRHEQMPEGDVPADDGNIGTALAGLLWLASGEPRYMQNACRAAYWYKNRVEEGKVGWCWSMGYGGMMIAEYYLMTGDKNILPGVESAAARIVKAQMPNGAWSHWSFNGYNAGYGAVNLAGMSCYIALLLARECGVKVDNRAIALADRYFEAFAPTVSNKYGNNPLEYTKMDYTGANGKAACISVAHRLNNKLIHSRNFALKAARSMDRLEKGHTGHFFNAMWTPIAASTINAKDYRACMDQMGWYFTLARHWRGGLFCPPSRGGSKYSTEGGVNMTTGGYGLALAVPRRRLRILGAPKSVFSVKLPAELEAAKQLHQSHQWDKTIAAVGAFLKKGGHNKETVRLANELRDKAKYVQAGIQEAYRKLEGLTGISDNLKAKMASRPYKVMGIITHLRMMLGEDDARLKEIEGRLPAKFRPIWRYSKNYNQSLRTIRQLSTYGWFVFASLLKKELPDFANPGDLPDWDTLVAVTPKNQSIKVMAIPTKAKMPKGWADLDFDDSSWKNRPSSPANTSGKRRKKKGAAPTRKLLVRVPFELTSARANLMRIRALKGMTGLSGDAKVYVNGECVLWARSGLRTSKKAGRDRSIQLLQRAKSLLKKGKNVLAISTSDDLPYVALDGDGIFSKQIKWTVDPARDAGIRKQVAKRRKPEAYHDFGKDKRTVDKCMAAFTAEPFFMPEAITAMMRFRVVLKNVPEREPYVKTLLHSSNWGARWAGLHILSFDLGLFDGSFEAGAYIRQVPVELRPLLARSKTGKQDTRVMAEKYLPQIIKLLNDPHPTVQKEACAVVRLLGPTAKDAAPALLKILKDVNGQPFRNRKDAYEAIRKIQPGTAVLQEATRVGMKDPSFAVRWATLQATVMAKDKKIAMAARQTYKSEFIDQIFTLPVSKTGKFAVAQAVLNGVSKDDLRPYLDRIFAGLSHRLGGQLKGSIEILLAFGDEVRPRLEKLAQSDDLVVRYNAITTLIKMTTGKLTPKRITFLKTCIQPLLKIQNNEKAEVAQYWLEALDADKPLYCSLKEISKSKKVDKSK